MGLRSERRPVVPDAPPELCRLVEPDPRDAARPAHRLITPARPPGLPPRLLVRAGLGSLGFALVLGVWFGRASVIGLASPPEIRIAGAGHLGAGPAAALVGPGGPFTDAAAIRERLLATGIAEEVLVERDLPGAIAVRLREKRAVALLVGEPPGAPPEALAADGTIIGRATAADFRWAGAPDLPVIHGVRRGHPEFAERAVLAGRLAGLLRTRPDLDRLVSELRVDEGPLRIAAVLRSPELTTLLPEDGFLDRLALVVGLAPELEARWPDLVGIDARIPDRLLLDFHRPPEPSAVPASLEGGSTE